jgi:hypothetical protein
LIWVRNKEVAIFYSVEYAEQYKDYITTISSKGAAVSYETAALIFNILSELVKNEQEQIWVDTGSGFSSFLLRAIAKQNPLVTVYSFDDHEGWLLKTIDYCAAQDVSIDNIMLWNDRPNLNGKCSFVFHDLGDRHTRATNAGAVLDMLAENGQLIFDDLHKRDMAVKIDEAIKARKLNYHEHEAIKAATLDNFGRWAGLIKKSSSLA